MQLDVQDDFVLKFKSASLTQSNPLYAGHLSSLVHFTAGTVYLHCVLSTHILNLTYVILLLQRMEPVTVALSSKEIRVIKCNGVSPGQGTQKHMYTLPSDYLSHIVVLGIQLCIVMSKVLCILTFACTRQHEGTNHVGPAVTFQVCVQDVLGSNLVQNNVYPDRDFSWYFPVLPDKCKDSTLVRS